jgi:putative transposase
METFQLFTTMKKFANRYRIPSARAPWWNYANSARYFITICTRNRKPFFGKIINGEIHLSDIGKIVQREWLITPDIRPDMNLKFGEFVVMPDHFHAIIEIGDNRFNGCRDASQCVSTEIPYGHFGPQSNNLAAVIRGFKSTVTTQSRIIDPQFGWQARYHDHIIRNETSFHNITRYIHDNPRIQKNRKPR